MNHMLASNVVLYAGKTWCENLLRITSTLNLLAFSFPKWMGPRTLVLEKWTVQCLYMPLGAPFFEDAPLVEFLHVAFTPMPGERCSGRLKVLLLCLCDVFRAPFRFLKKYPANFSKSLQQTQQTSQKVPNKLQQTSLKVSNKLPQQTSQNVSNKRLQRTSPTKCPTCSVDRNKHLKSCSLF